MNTHHLWPANTYCNHIQQLAHITKVITKTYIFCFEFNSARRGRIYLPQEELALAGLSADDIFRGQVTDKWRNFMKGQIKRARMFFDNAEKGVSELNSASRWPVWASLLLYRQILDAIEANDYNNFTKRAYVGKAKKLAFLPVAYGRALLVPSSNLTKLASR